MTKIQSWPQADCYKWSLCITPVNGLINLNWGIIGVTVVISPRNFRGVMGPYFEVVTCWSHPSARQVAEMLPTPAPLRAACAVRLSTGGDSRQTWRQNSLRSRVPKTNGSQLSTWKIGRNPKGNKKKSSKHPFADALAVSFRESKNFFGFV